MTQAFSQTLNGHLLYTFTRLVLSSVEFSRTLWIFVDKVAFNVGKSEYSRDSLSTIRLD